MPKQIFALIAVGLLSSCGGGVNSPRPVTQQKIGTLFGTDTASPNSVYAMSIFSDGTVATIPGSPFAACAGPLGLAASGSSHLLFVGCSTGFLNGSLSVFNISTNGSLSSVGPAVTNDLIEPFTLSLTGDGSFLLVDNGNFSPAIFRINPVSGSVAELPLLANAPSAATFSRDGNFIVSVGDPNIYSFLFDRGTGTAQSVSSASGFFATLPTPPVFHPSSKWVYVPYSSGIITPGPPPPGGIAGFVLAADGSLTPLPGSPFASGFDFGSSVGTPFLAAVVDPQGSHLYAETATAVFGFNIDQTSGSLSPMGGAYPFFSSTGIDNPVALTFDASGQFLFVFVLRLAPGGIASYLNSYSVGRDGVPRLVLGGPFHMGNQVNSMTAIP